MASTSVFLNVRDIDKSLEWYERLGFRVANRVQGKSGRTWWADLDLDGAELGLGAIEANNDPAYREWVSTPLGAGVVVYFTVPDVDRYYERAKEIGTVRSRSEDETAASEARCGDMIEAEIEDRPYGRVFTLNDPDGYTINFITEK